MMNEHALETETTEIETASNTEPQVPAFGYDLIREYLLNEILGKEAPQLLYWGGKQLARNFPLHTLDEIIEFFKSAGWGTLYPRKETKDQFEFELTGDGVLRRLSINENCHFQLEAGFLAQQFENQKKVTAEAIEESKKRAKKVNFIVKWDTKDLL